VSVAAPPERTAGADAGAAGPAAGERCPLCGAALNPEQDWCLHCGAAARTRLAASPNWQAPAIALAVVIVLALGVLAASLVKLAGGSSTSPALTTTVTVRAAASSTLGSAATGGATARTGHSGAAGAAAGRPGGAAGATGRHATTSPSFVTRSEVAGRKPVLPGPHGKGRRVRSPAAEKLLREFAEPHARPQSKQVTEAEAITREKLAAEARRAAEARHAGG